METSRSAGGVVLGDQGTIVLVRVREGDGALLFPKGHVEPGETDEEAARREIQEETGLANIEFIDDLGSYTRPHIRKDGSLNENEQKEIHMFLFAAPPGATLAPTMEIEHVEWVPYREVAARLGNTADRAWFATIFDRVREAVQRD
ncbi:MAG TPA: NUDIX hydrolase [Candidatus Paceibacterota bacterium]|nr:NUDIX hydrolase [Candidatus Paceibacterota bacterium]